jgi:hypothetical protein
MLPTVLRERLDVLADLGFTYDAERGMFYHQGTEYGRRKAEPEEVSLEKFTNYLDVSTVFPQAHFGSASYNLAIYFFMCYEKKI